MTYEWTDWIEHVPGQELPVGFYVLFEFLGDFRNGGKPYQQEGPIVPKMKGHLCWHMTTPSDPSACMLVRYKLRVEREEVEVEEAREMETA